MGMRDLAAVISPNPAAPGADSAAPSIGGLELGDLKFARPFLGAGGRAMAMCSAREDLTQMPSGSEIVDYNLPDGTPRRLVISKLTA